MKSELFLYKPNIIKNFNFTETNFYIPTSGTDTQVIWATNTCWTLFDGYAQCTSSDTTSLAQGGLFKYNTDYKVTVNITTVTGGNLYVYVGVNHFTITAPGLYTFNLNSGVGDDLEIFCDTGVTAVVNWVKVIELPEVYNVYLGDDISIPVTYNIADIRDPSKRNGSFTKTITIPGTKENNLIFNEIYEIDGDSNYNPNKKIKAVLYYNGEEQLLGYLQLKTINRKQNGLSNYNLISYEITLIGGVTDLFTDLGTSQLSDLGYNEYQHNYTLPNQIMTWDTSIIKNGSVFNNFTNGTSRTISSIQIASDGRAQINFTTAHGFSKFDQIFINITATAAHKIYEGDQRVFSVVSTTAITIFFPFTSITGTVTGTVYKHNPIGDGYVYPMIYTGAHASGSQMDGITWEVRDFAPAIYIKTYLDKLANKFGYTFQSNFFDSADFKRLTLIAGNKIFGPSNTQLNHRAFQATKTDTISNSFNIRFSSYAIVTPIVIAVFIHQTTSPTNHVYDLIFQDDFNAPNFDNSGDYNTTTGKWSPSITGTYTLSTVLTYEQTATIDSNITSILNTTGADMKLTVQVIDYTTGLDVVAPSVKTYNFSTFTSFTDTFNVTTAPFVALVGHNYGVRLVVDDIAGFSATIPNPLPSPAPSATVNWTIKQGATFFNTPIQAPYLDGDTVDMVSAVPKMTCKDFMLDLISMFNLYIETSRLDDRILLIEPRDDYYNTNIIEDWTPKLDLDNDVIIQPMAELNAKTYEYKFKDDKAILNDEHLKEAGYNYGDKIYNIENDFVTATNTTSLTTSSGVLLEFPNFSNRIITGIYSEENNLRSKVDGNPRILYFGVASSANSSIPTWNYTSTIASDTINNLTRYLYAGHLDKVRGPYRDYNFGYPEKISFVSNQWTSANLYNLYYSNMINEITSQNNKLITVNIYLKPSDISKLNFRSKYLIDGHYLRLNRIIEYIPGNINTTKCEFSKIEIGKIYNPTYIGYTGPSTPFPISVLDGQRLPQTPTTVHNPNIKDFGYNNNISQLGSFNVLIKGNNNIIGPYLNNVTVLDSNNVMVYGGLSNVSIINTSNVTVKESNVTIVNGLIISGGGSILNSNINYIDAGVDIVLSPFNTNTIINNIDAGLDAVLNLGTNSLTNNIDSGSDVIL